MWRNQASEAINTFGIIPTEANLLMEMIHNTKKGMPLIIDCKDLLSWLDPDMKLKEHISQFLKPYDERLMEAHNILRFALNPRNERNTP